MSKIFIDNYIFWKIEVESEEEEIQEKIAEEVIKAISKLLSEGKI